MKLIDLKESSLGDEIQNINANIDDDSIGGPEMLNQLKSLVQIIKVNCAPWLNAVSGGDLARYVSNPFYRGNHHPRRIFYKPVRTDREPRDSIPQVQNEINNFMQSLGAEAHRGNSAFITRDTDIAEGYGYVFMVFPVGPVSYTWIKGMEDFTGEFNTMLRKIALDTTGENIDFMGNLNLDSVIHSHILEFTLEEMKKEIKSNININKNINQVNDEEVIVKAEGMIYVSTFFEPYLEKILNS